MRISDWSSDVCSSDLRTRGIGAPGSRRRRPLARCLHHEVAPDARGHAAARYAAKRAIVGVADPYPDDEAAGIADEQRGAIVLRRAGLAVIGLRQPRRAAGAASDRGAQPLLDILMHARTVTRRDPAAGFETKRP